MPRDPLSIVIAAIATGDVGRVQELLDADTRISRSISGGRTLLAAATASRRWTTREALVAALLRSGADPNGRSLDGTTPLMSAAVSGHVALVVQLLEAGARIDTEDNAGISALSYAAACGHAWIVAILLRKGARADAQSSTGITPLGCASANGQLRTARLLILAGAQLDAFDQEGDTAVLLAGRANCPELVRVLADAGADVYHRNNAGHSVLCEAINGKRTEIVSTIRSCPGLEIVRALVIQGKAGMRLCGVCGASLGGMVDAVHSHYLVEHRLDLTAAEASRLLSEPLVKNRTETGGGFREVSGGLPSLGKRR